MVTQKHLGIWHRHDLTKDFDAIRVSVYHISKDKSTLNKMGNPQYVQFLVNPEEMFIAVLGSDRPLTGGTSNRVKLVQTSRHYSVEFYSNTLLCALVNMIGTLDFQYSYRMSGEVDVANRVAYFSMKTLKKNERRPPSDG